MSSAPSIVATTPEPGVHVLRFDGCWTLETMPPIDLASLVPREGTLRFEALHAEAVDTSLAMTVTRLADETDGTAVKLDLSGLPDGVAKLVGLARAVPEQEARTPEKPGFITAAGMNAVELWDSIQATLAFCGEASLALVRTLKNPKTFRWRDFSILLGDCGFRALPIVGLIAFLTGLILAFVGAVQLRVFGADVYVADLVGLAMSREMASLMTAMVMAGRSGAAFAAHLGTMKVSEEIDALSTFGFHPVDMLALPRLLALIIMMPLLTLYANLLGYFGGALIGYSMLDISLTQYLFETQTIVTTVDISIGLVKSAVFGFIISASGCMQGLNCGKDAAAVGHAATRAVVTSITTIVVADAIFAVICEILKI
ncbi:MAG: phospholipid/cholesterol/gamma-HCH transport system permease protein [Verrucomicrobiales bacterium]